MTTIEHNPDTPQPGDAEPAKINFLTRKWVRPEDMNAHGTLFGGSLLRWIDDEAVVYAVIQLGQRQVVTKYISEINFVSSARLGDIIEIGLVATRFGRTSITCAPKSATSSPMRASSPSTRWFSSVSTTRGGRSRTATRTWHGRANDSPAQRRQQTESPD